MSAHLPSVLGLRWSAARTAVPGRRKRRTGWPGRRGRLALEPLEPRLLLARTLFVDDTASGANSGASWTDAYTSLQSALTAAASGDEIWVAQGTYRPATTANRSATFQLKDDVSVYGGFPDGGGTWAQRDWTANSSVLSGDLGVAGDKSDNSYHVVKGADGAILDGFTITGGNANVWYTDEAGGGMFNDGVSPIVVNCAFLRNNALYGGGAMKNIDASPQVVNCLFLGNDGGAHGGAISFEDSAANVSNSVFVGNQADEGGAIEVRASSVEITNCTFTANTAIMAGALFGGGPLDVKNCIFWGDTASYMGSEVVVGGTSVFSYSDVQGGVNGAGFSGATVLDGGGNMAADPLFVRPPQPGTDGSWGTNDDDYGDLQLAGSSPCIDAGDNTALPADAGDLNENGDRSEPLPLDLDGAPRRADVSAVPDTGSGTTPIVDMGAYEVPQLIVSTLTDESDGDFSDGDLSLREALWLASQQPGNDVITFKETLRGGTIVLDAALGELAIDSNVDIQGHGADQLTVDAAGNSRVFNTVAGIAATISGLTITGGNAGTGPGAYGGGLYVVAGATVTLDSVIVTDNEADTGGGIYNEGTLTLRHTIVSDNTAIDGAGICNRGAASLFEVAVLRNHALAAGGGILSEQGSLSAVQSTVSENEADSSGGGLHVSDTVTLTDVTISDNTAGMGGGILSQGIVELRRCAVTGNEATQAGGGGIWNHLQLDVANCTISGNVASSSTSGVGGGIYQQGAFPLKLTNVTVAVNRAHHAGGGIWTAAEPPVLHNTIVAGNFLGAGTTPDDVHGDFSPASSYNVIGSGDGSTGIAGSGNLVGTAAAPLDPNLGPLTDNGGLTLTHALLPQSPAVDAGDNARAADAGLTTDQRGTGFPRFVDGNTDGTATVDIGAFEADFASHGEIHGIVWNDLNGDGVIDANESGLANRTVFLDTDGDGQVDPTELSTTTAPDGTYEFLHLAAPHTYTVAELLPTGWSQTCPLPARTYTVPLAAGQVVNDAKFGNQELVQVVAISPAPGALLETGPSTIVATFSVAIDPATVTTQTFRLVGSGGDGVFGNGNEVVITPSEVTLTDPTHATMDLAGVIVADDTYQITLVGDATAPMPLRIASLAGTVLDGDGDGTPGGDYVALLTIAAPSIETSSDILDFGTSESSLDLFVRNVGGGTVTYTVEAPNFTVSAAFYVPLSVTPFNGTSGGEWVQHTVTLNAGDLPAGIYEGDLIVSDGATARTVKVRFQKGTIIDLASDDTYRPAENGFHFRNFGLASWNGVHINYGRCVGMSYASSYYWLLGIPTQTKDQWGGAETYQAPNGDEWDVPPQGNTQRLYVSQVQLSRFTDPSMWPFVAQLLIDQSSLHIQMQYTSIAGTLSAGLPSPIVLKESSGGAHGVLVWRIAETAEEKVLWIYDPNYPDTNERAVRLRVQNGAWSMETYDGSYTRIAWLPPLYPQDFALAYILHSPAHLRVTDPDGNVVVVDGVYPDGMAAWRGDIEGDGEEEEIVAFANPVLGNYEVEAIPFTNADPTATITLESVIWGQKQTLLDHVPVADLPGSPISVHVPPRTLVVTVDPLTTSRTSPALHGTIDDPHVVVVVTVAGNEYEAVNNGDGTWLLEAGLVTPPLAEGVYDVQVIAMDGAGNQGTDTTTNELTIRNTPPVLDPSGSMSLTSINMNETDNPGTLVTEIIASAGGDRITDPDPDALEGIAIVAVDRNHGAWEYSTDDGSTWLAVGSPSEAAALLLASDASTRLRFVPEHDFAGTVERGIMFRAWDQTTGSNGQTADVWSSGGGTAFSTLVAMASITVLTVNHPPAEIVLDNSEVKENRPGDVIGSLTVVDEDADDTHTFSVADSRFEVTDGILKLKAGACLDEVVDAGLGVEVTATDDGGLSLARTFTLTVLKNDFPWSPVLPRDVDGNGMVQAVDVLIVINEINARGIRPLPVPPPAIPAFCFDAAPNNVIEAADVLAVINHINSHPAAAGEAESAVDALLAATAAETCRRARWPTEGVGHETLGWRSSIRPLPAQGHSDPLLPWAVPGRIDRNAEIYTTAQSEPVSEDAALAPLALDDVLAEIAEDVFDAVRAFRGAPAKRALLWI